jgi:hypothetical protein
MIASKRLAFFELLISSLCPNRNVRHVGGGLLRSARKDQVNEARAVTSGSAHCSSFSKGNRGLGEDPTAVVLCADPAGSSRNPYKGGLREQFIHVIDVVPTILEVAGIRAPEMVDGIKQAPIKGISFAYTFDKANAKVSTRHKTQYFEMMGSGPL